jgi:hypothetical protein
MPVLPVMTVLSLVRLLSNGPNSPVVTIVAITTLFQGSTIMRTVIRLAIELGVVVGAIALLAQIEDFWPQALIVAVVTIKFVKWNWPIMSRKR